MPGIAASAHASAYFHHICPRALQSSTNPFISSFKASSDALLQRTKKSLEAFVGSLPEAVRPQMESLLLSGPPSAPSGISRSLDCRRNVVATKVGWALGKCSLCARHTSFGSPSKATMLRQGGLGNWQPCLTLRHVTCCRPSAAVLPPAGHGQPVRGIARCAAQPANQGH